MEPALTRLSLEIEVDSEPIAGRVIGASEPPQRFLGWIELAGVIERERVRGGRVEELRWLRAPGAAAARP